jgi:hypothetical protein
MITTYPQKDKLTQLIHYSTSLVHNSKCCAMNQWYQHKKNAVQTNMLKLQVEASYSRDRDTRHEHPMQHGLLEDSDGLLNVAARHGIQTYRIWQIAHLMCSIKTSRSRFCSVGPLCIHNLLSAIATIASQRALHSHARRYRNVYIRINLLQLLSRGHCAVALEVAHAKSPSLNRNWSANAITLSSANPTPSTPHNTKFWARRETRIGSRQSQEMASFQNYPWIALLTSGRPLFDPF